MPEILDEVIHEEKEHKVRGLFQKVLSLLSSVTLIILFVIFAYNWWYESKNEVLSNEAEIYAKADLALRSASDIQGAEQGLKKLMNSGATFYRDLAAARYISNLIRDEKFAEAYSLADKASNYLDTKFLQDQKTLYKILLAVKSNNIGIMDAISAIDQYISEDRYFTESAVLIKASMLYDMGKIDEARSVIQELALYANSASELAGLVKNLYKDQ